MSNMLGTSRIASGFRFCVCSLCYGGKRGRSQQKHFSRRHNRQLEKHFWRKDQGCT